MQQGAFAKILLVLALYIVFHMYSYKLLCRLGFFIQTI